MSRLFYHEKSDRRKWAAITIVVLLIIAAIVLGVLSNWYTDFNKYCVFGHDYGEDNKCVRCGKEKPIENEPEVEPQAFISEPYRMSTASARPLMASNDGTAAQSDDMGLEAVSTWNVGTICPEKEDFLQDVSSIEDLPINTSFNEYVLISTYGALRPTRKVITISNTFFQGISIGSGVPISNSEHKNYHICYLRVDEASTWKEFIRNNPDNTLVDKEVTIEPIQLNGAGQYKVCLVKHNSASNIIEARSDIFTVNFNVQALPPAPSKLGYTFTGWYTDEACTNKYTASTVTADITLYAGFRAHTYSIKFNANIGSGTMANLAMTYDQAKNLTNNSFTKDHYQFKGWATSADGNVIYSNSQSVKNLTATDNATVELFAVWERSEVKVDFVSEGNTVATNWIAIGTKATLPVNPSKVGHTFVGWYFADGTEYTTQNISEDTVLTAKFEVIQCVVTFMVDGVVYAVYVCDWGTSLAEALNANDVNPVLLQTEDEYSRNF